MSLDKVQIHQISLEKIQISETNLPIAQRYSLKISSYIIDDIIPRIQNILIGLFLYQNINFKS